MLPYYEVDGSIVVVIDIFRASSAIVTAIGSGVESVIPVKNLEEAHDYKNRGYIVAAERKGEVVNGFDFGNSPYSFMAEELKGKQIALTTTNCTTAIHEIGAAHAVVIGSFVNMSALCNYLLSKPNDILLLCAGWKNRFNLEDSIFAGAVAARLKEHFNIFCDSALAAMHMYELSRGNLKQYLSHSSHARRLRHLHTGKDIDFCLTEDQFDVVPVYADKAIRKLG